MTICLLVTVGRLQYKYVRPQNVVAEPIWFARSELSPEKYQYDAGGSSGDGEAEGPFREQQSYRDTSARKCFFREYNNLKMQIE